jgi:hypothetical protein
MISKDFSERDDVASRFPAKLKALKATFWCPANQSLGVDY